MIPFSFYFRKKQHTPPKKAHGNHAWRGSHCPCGTGRVDCSRPLLHLPSLVLSQRSPRDTLFFQKRNQSRRPGPRGSQGLGAPRAAGLPALSHCTRVSSFPRILPGTQPCPHTRPGLHTGRWRVPETVLAQVKHFPLESGGQEGFTGRNVPWPPSGQGCPGPLHPPGHKTRRNGHSPPCRWTPVLSQTRPCHAY